MSRFEESGLFATLSTTSRAKGHYSLLLYQSARKYSLSAPIYTHTLSISCSLVEILTVNANESDGKNITLAEGKQKKRPARQVVPNAARETKKRRHDKSCQTLQLVTTLRVVTVLKSDCSALKCELRSQRCNWSRHFVS